MPVYISVSGWLHDELDDFSSSWKCLTHLNAFGEFYALQWESKHLISLGEVMLAPAPIYHNTEVTFKCSRL